VVEEVVKGEIGRREEARWQSVWREMTIVAWVRGVGGGLEELVCDEEGGEVGR